MKLRLFAVVMALVAAPFAFAADEKTPTRRPRSATSPPTR